MKKVILILSALFIFSTNAIAADKKGGETNAQETTTPKWINGELPEKWSGSGYLSAVGTGSTRNQAINDAKKELGGVFISEIKSISKSLKESKLEESTTGKTSGTDTSASKVDTTINTNIELRGVEIKETYQDKANKTFYALAVLDKLKAKNIYLLSLNKIKTDVNSKYEAFMSSPSKDKYSQIKKQLDKFEQMNKEYVVVNSGISNGMPLDDEKMNKLNQEFEKLTSKNLVYFEVEGDFDDGLKNKIQSCTTDNSTKLTEDVKQATHKIKLKFSEQDQKIKVEGFVKFRYQVDASVTDISKNITKKATADKVESGRSKEQSLENVKEELSKAICEKIDGLI